MVDPAAEDPEVVVAADQEEVVRVAAPAVAVDRAVEDLEWVPAADRPSGNRAEEVTAVAGAQAAGREGADPAAGITAVGDPAAADGIIAVAGTTAAPARGTDEVTTAEVTGTVIRDGPILREGMPTPAGPIPLGGTSTQTDPSPAVDVLFQSPCCRA